MSANEIMNSPLMWLACGACVAWVIFQALLFLYKAMKVSTEVGLNKEQINQAIKASTVASIGPSLAVLVSMIALLVSMGGAISWFRLSYIGSVAYEMYAAEVGAQVTGSALGAEMTGEAFATGVWVMTIGCLGFTLLTALFTDKLDKLQNFMAGGKAEVLSVLAVCAMCGAFSYLCMGRVFRMDSQTVACLAGFAIMAVFMIINKKAQKKWIKDWGFTIAMFGGMLISVIAM